MNRWMVSLERIADDREPLILPSIEPLDHAQIPWRPSGSARRDCDPAWLPWFVILGRVAAEISAPQHARSFYELLLPYHQYVGGCGGLRLPLCSNGHQPTDPRHARPEPRSLRSSARPHRNGAASRAENGRDSGRGALHLEIARLHRLRERPELAVTPLEAARRIATETGMKGVLREIAELERKK